MSWFKDIRGTEFTTNDGSPPTAYTPVKLPDGSTGTWMGEVIKDK